MSFHGPQRKGALRELRKTKRAEARDRNRETPPERRKKARRAAERLTQASPDAPREVS